MSRYQQRHYEDVARLLLPLQRADCVCEDCADHWCPDTDCACACHIPATIVPAFADLFATDNPPVRGKCCGHPECDNWVIVGGFNRDWFLEACGLEQETEVKCSTCGAPATTFVDGDCSECNPPVGECSGPATCVDHPEEA